MAREGNLEPAEQKPAPDTLFLCTIPPPFTYLYILSSCSSVLEGSEIEGVKVAYLSVLFCSVGEISKNLLYCMCVMM